MSNSKKKRIIFLISHPIQYFSPLFQLMAKEENLDLLVLYCSDENLKGHVDKGFGVKVKWDIPLLDGYDYHFIKNNSWKPSAANGFWGLINFGIFKIFKEERGSYLVIHGWNYATNLMAIMYAKIIGLTICMRGDNPFNQEKLKNKNLLFLKKILLGKFLFKFIDYFLFVGVQNKKFYEFYGVQEQKLIFTPHAVDNDRFKAEYEKYRDKKTEIRKELELTADKIIILTVGKYIPVKNHLILLRAFQLLNNPDSALVIVGEGQLRKKMEDYIKINNLKNIYLTGFKNQSEVGKYFAAADIFVLPSQSETWGLVVNEAMNFGLPIIISDTVGCADDLVKENENGFKFTNGDISELVAKIEILLNDNNLRNNFGQNSIEIVKNYSFTNIIDAIKNY